MDIIKNKPFLCRVVNTETHNILMNDSTFDVRDVLISAPLITTVTVVLLGQRSLTVTVVLLGQRSLKATNLTNSKTADECV